jgi:hypothetical protein
MIRRAQPNLMLKEIQLLTAIIAELTLQSGITLIDVKGLT